MPGGFNRQICSAGKGRATYCSTWPAELPVCEEVTAGQRPRLAARKGGDRDTSSAVAGGLAAAAGGMLAVAVAAAALGLRQRQRRRQQRAAQLPPASWDGELANLLPHSGAQLQHRDSAAAAPAGSKLSSSSRGSKTAAQGTSAVGSGERWGPRSSWRLHSRSLQLQADDFQILLDKSGRPDLLGTGASAKVGGWQAGCLPMDAAVCGATALVMAIAVAHHPQAAPPAARPTHAPRPAARNESHQDSDQAFHVCCESPSLIKPFLFTRRCTAACCTAHSQWPSRFWLPPPPASCWTHLPGLL